MTSMWSSCRVVICPAVTIVPHRYETAPSVERLFAELCEYFCHSSSSALLASWLGSGVGGQAP